MIDPSTPQEWQEAVDAAQGALALDAARAYGLVTGGPEVDIARCESIIKQAREMGYAPSEDSVERFVEQLG